MFTRQAANVQGALLACLAVAAALAVVFFRPVADVARSLGLIGWRASPGLLVFTVTLALTAVQILRRRDSGLSGFIAGLLGVSGLMDGFGYRVFSQEVLCVVAAVPLVLACLLTGQLRRTPIGVKVAYCLAASIILG